MKEQIWATEEGTAAYRDALGDRVSGEHFRNVQGLWWSSVGIGTYLGGHDDATDELYRKAVVRAVELGANVIDTAINYRFQRSERSVGTALKELAASGVGRSELVLATKGGFIPFDGAPPKDVRAYFLKTFVEPGILNPRDIVAGCHSLAPRYLTSQLDQSLRNLAVQCVDVYYVHNPETQLGELTREEFNGRLVAAFEAMEAAVTADKIRMYGTATWNGYRNDPEASDYLSLADVVSMAERAGGKDHHFRVIQLPLNLGMAEAVTKRNQMVNGRMLTVLEAARELGISVMTSASVLQGQLTRNLPKFVGEVLDGPTTDGQRALQFVRSAPGVTTALVGMKQVAHVEENLGLAGIAPAPQEKFLRLFESAGKRES